MKVALRAVPAKSEALNKAKCDYFYYSLKIPIPDGKLTSSAAIFGNSKVPYGPLGQMALESRAGKLKDDIIQEEKTGYHDCFNILFSLCCDGVYFYLI